MVTRRGRQWIQRGVMSAVVLVIIGLALGSWFTSEAIESELLVVIGGDNEIDPGTVGLSFVAIDVPGPLGNYPAWSIPGVAGRSDTWAVHVHGHEADRAQTINLLPTFAQHGIDSLVVTYRNDQGAPPSDGSHHGIGADEWEDVEAAVLLAADLGAQDFVLVGYGSGGAVVLTFLRESILAERVVGVVLDSPYLDPGSMVDAWREADSVPGFLTGWGKALATFRFGVDWAILDQVAAAGDFVAPMLLIQGVSDTTAQVGSADAFAEGLPGLVEYLRLDGVEHLGGYASDPDLYSATVGQFLKRVAVGPMVLPEFVPDPDVE